MRPCSRNRSRSFSANRRARRQTVHIPCLDGIRIRLRAAFVQWERIGHFPVVRDAFGHRVSLLRVLHGRYQDLLESERAEAFERRLPAPHSARHGHRQDAAHRHSRGRPPILRIPAITQCVEPRERRPGRRRAARIQHIYLFLLRDIDDRKEIPAHSHHHGLDHVEHRRGRHCRIDCVSAAHENLQSRLRSQRLTGHHQPVLRHHLGPSLRRPALRPNSPHRTAKRRQRFCSARSTGRRRLRDGMGRAEHQDKRRQHGRDDRVLFHQRLPSTRHRSIHVARKSSNILPNPAISSSCG